jgi:hypothetical protein
MRPCDVEDTEEREDASGLVATRDWLREVENEIRKHRDGNSIVESYWKLSHIFSMVDPLIYQKWLPLVEDENTSFVSFVKRVGENDSGKE